MSFFAFDFDRTLQLTLLVNAGRANALDMYNLAKDPVIKGHYLKQISLADNLMDFLRDSKCLLLDNVPLKK